MVDDIAALDRSIDHGETLQGFNGRLREKRHKAKAYTVLLLELVAIAFAQRHDLGQVDLVERRQHRGRLLRLDEALRDARTQTRHGHPLFLSLRSRNDDLLRHFRLFAGGNLASTFFFQERHHVGFGNAAILACAGNHGGLQVVLLEQATHRRTGLDRSFFLRRLRRRFTGSLLHIFLLFRRRFGRHAGVAFLEDSQYVAGDYRGAIFDNNL